MKRPTLLWLVAIAAAAGLVAILGAGDLGATSSSLSRDAGGWLAARRYLEARGADVGILDVPLSEWEPGSSRPGAPPGTLVLALPWQQPLALGELDALGEHLRAGGAIVLAYSGGPPEPREARVLATLALETERVRAPPPLLPWRWWSFRRQRWLLRPDRDRPEEGLPGVAAAAFEHAPAAPPETRVLYRGGDGDVPLIFEYGFHRGRVVVLPAAVFANAWIGEAGNADLLESLLLDLGPAWTFDEYHHGLVAADVTERSATGFAWDLFAAHLALLYLLGVASLARPFGPPWRERTASTGSTASFLRHLGALHRELGHHAQAAEVLVERARALDPDLTPPAAAAGARDEKRFLELARTISRLQRRAI